MSYKPKDPLVTMLENTPPLQVGRIESATARVRKMSAGIRQSLEMLRKAENKNAGGEKSGTICIGSGNGTPN